MFCVSKIHKLSILIQSFTYSVTQQILIVYWVPNTIPWSFLTDEYSFAFKQYALEGNVPTHFLLIFRFFAP